MSRTSGWIRPSKFRFPDSTAATDRSPSATASDTPGSSGPELPMQVVQPNPTRSNPRAVERCGEPGALVVVHDDPRPGGERGLHPRLRPQTPGHRLLGQEAGGQHDLGVGGVRAAGDGGDDDVTVGDLHRRARRPAWPWPSAGPPWLGAPGGVEGACGSRPSTPTATPGPGAGPGRPGSARRSTRSSSTLSENTGASSPGPVEETLLLGVGLDQGHVVVGRDR